MPSTTSSSVSRPSPPRRINALIADLGHGLGDHLADLAPPLAEMVPTCAISSLVETFSNASFTSSTTSGDGEIDAAAQIHRVEAGGHRFHASRTMAAASTVAVVVRHREVVGLRRDLAHHLCAHILELGRRARSPWRRSRRPW